MFFFQILYSWQGRSKGGRDQSPRLLRAGRQRVPSRRLRLAAPAVGKPRLQPRARITLARTDRGAESAKEQIGRTSLMTWFSPDGSTSSSSMLMGAWADAILGSWVVWRSCGGRANCESGAVLGRQWTSRLACGYGRAGSELDGGAAGGRGRGWQSPRRKPPAHAALLVRRTKAAGGVGRLSLTRAPPDHDLALDDPGPTATACHAVLEARHGRAWLDGRSRVRGRGRPARATGGQQVRQPLAPSAARAAAHLPAPFVPLELTTLTHRFR